MGLSMKGINIKNMKIFYQTFGCKVNSFETSAVANILSQHGFCSTEDKSLADIVFINSCTVTETGDSKTQKFMRSIKASNPNCIIVLSGCFPQASPETAKNIPEADIICGNKNRKDIPFLLSQFIKDKHQIIEIPQHQKGDRFESIESPIHIKHTRAFIKIQDGCDRFCAYCIVPYARGPVRSLSLELIKQQAETLAKKGYKEVVVSGINLSRYGVDLNLNLADAVQAISENDEIKRIRLGSLEPDLLTDDILQRLSSMKKICPSFHLSLQSGSNETLKRMNRRYSAEQFVEVKKKIETLFDSPTFTTDIIVGFPGETEQEFNDSLDFVKSMRFLKCHVFPYSKRKGTKAAGFPDQVPEQTKKERSQIMNALCESIREQIIKSYDNKTVEVLTEKQNKQGFFTGYTSHYIPAKVFGNISRNEIISSKAKVSTNFILQLTKE